MTETSITESYTEPIQVSYCISSRSNPHLILNDHYFHMTDKKANKNGKIFWRCLRHAHQCRARCITLNGVAHTYRLEHNHEPYPDYLNGKVIFPTLEALYAHQKSQAKKL